MRFSSSGRCARLADRLYRAGGALSPVVELRARLLWRRFRSEKGKLEAMAVTALFILAIPMGLLFATLIGAGSYKAARVGAGLELASVSAIYFGIWQAWTAVALAINDRDVLDLRRFLVYPIRPARIYFFGLASGLLGDPVAFFWMLLVGGVFVGAAAARPGVWLIALAILLVTFAAATMLMVVLIQEGMARLLRSRRLREVGSGAAIVAAMWMFAAAMGGGVPSVRHAILMLARIRWIAFPAALTSEAAKRLYAGNVWAGLGWSALLIGATGLAGFVAFRLALASAQEGGEPAVAVTSGRPARFPLLRGRFGALLEKDLKLLVRHPLARIYAIIIPGLAAVVSWRITSYMPDDARELARALPLLGLALYVPLMLQPFWLNGFGWERGGARLLCLAPVRGSDVVLSKNAAILLFSLVVFSISAAISAAVGETPPVWALLSGFALQAGVAPVLFGLGNLVTILNPKAASFGVQRGANISALSGLLGLIILTVTSGLFGVPVLVALGLDSLWLVPTSWVFIGLVSFGIYWKTLPAVGRLFERRREDILGTVCGDET
jgi:ABC-2 type transport system permease protein